MLMLRPIIHVYKKGENAAYSPFSPFEN